MRPLDELGRAARPLAAVRVALVVGTIATALAAATPTEAGYSGRTLAWCAQFVAQMRNKPTGQWTPNEDSLYQSCDADLELNKRVHLSNRPIVTTSTVRVTFLGDRDRFDSINSGTLPALYELKQLLGGENRGAMTYVPGKAITPYLFVDGSPAQPSPETVLVAIGGLVGVISKHDYDLSRKS